MANNSKKTTKDSDSDDKFRLKYFRTNNGTWLSIIDEWMKYLIYKITISYCSGPDWRRDTFSDWLKCYRERDSVRIIDLVAKFMANRSGWILYSRRRAAPLVRSAPLRTASGSYSRPINKIGLKYSDVKINVVPSRN